MRTNNKPLTLKQQEKLYNDMRNKGITQTKIAKINNLSNSQTIHEVCTGQYNITPLMKKYFLNAGIDLDKIRNDKVIITLNEKLPPYFYVKKTYRRLTQAQACELRFRLTEYFKKDWNLTDVYKAIGVLPQMVCNLLHRRYPVSPMMIEKFKKINIDLEDL